jgi:hypothetical protein
VSVFARATEKQKNNAFDSLVRRAITPSIPLRAMSQDDAEVAVAASAGGAIPAFNNTLNNKFASANPNMIESAGRQVDKLIGMNAGNALTGLSKESKAVYTKYQALRQSMEPSEAAKIAHETVYNQDPAMVQMNNEKWTNFLSTSKPQGTSPDIFALQQVHLDPGDMRSPSVYGNDILEEFKTYFTMLNGDVVNAKKMLAESVRQNYGSTMVNGIYEVTKNPIEQALNLPHDSTGVIQQDISEQLQSHFSESKKLYDAKQINEYWEVLPRATSKDVIESMGEKNKLDVTSRMNVPLLDLMKRSGDVESFKAGKPIEVVRHFRGGTSQKFKVVIQMNPFASKSNNLAHPVVGGWDVSVDSGSGVHLLNRVAPYLGTVNYSPNMDAIKRNYNALHPLN